MYYRLTYTASSRKERLGDSVLNSCKPLSIGQGIYSDVKLPDSERFEPQPYASILQCQDGSGWYIVRRTDFHKISINDAGLNIAQRLSNGDLLTFSDGEIYTTLKYEVFDDAELDTTNGILYQKYKSHKSYYLLAIASAILAICLGGYSLIVQSQKDLHNYGLINHFGQSIYHISTDSVYLLCDTLIDGEHKQIVTESIELEKVAEGTAFLTEDSLFVTARHCIEPWINDEEWNGIPDESKMSPEVKLAIMAETGNRRAGYEKYTLRAHCVISKGFERYNYYSTDFCMNKSRDLVIRLGMAEKAVYWRTIIPIAQRKDMELGDFAYIKERNLEKDTKDSEISMASREEIVSFSQSRNLDIAVMGYPLNDKGTDFVSVNFGNLMGAEHDVSQHSSIGCLQLSADINPGNSGGPVFAKIGNEIKVIGIVSKVDGRASQGTFWAVPIAEVQSMHEQGDVAKEDSVMYRR